MKILISAAEASSDVHGAELLKALKTHAPPGTSIEAIGIGGPKLQAAGLRALVDAREMLSMGFAEILSRLPRILRALRTLVDWAQRERPDVVVVIDYPDFHFRLAKKLRASGIPVVYYIPPKVWVWRSGRVRVMRELFRKVLCIFPFEEEFFRGAGLPITYVGNPLIDELPLSMTQAEARAKLGVRADARVLAVLPGSRPAELKYHLEVMLDAVEKTAEKLSSQLVAAIALPETGDPDFVKTRIEAWKTKRGTPPHAEFRISRGDSALVMRAADAGIIKSGTSTLEAALLGLPHVVMYNGSWITGIIFKYFIRYRGPIGLVNLVPGCKPGDRYVANEYLGKDASPETLSAEAFDLMTNAERRAWVSARFQEIRERLRVPGGGLNPSARAAIEVLELAGCSRH